MDDLEAWNRWWRQRGEAGLRALLMGMWDPIGVAGIPEAKDEYDNYLLPLAQRLRAGASADEVARYLRDVRVSWIGLSADPESDHETGSRIKAWYESETGEYQDETRKWWE